MYNMAEGKTGDSFTLCLFLLGTKCFADMVIIISIDIGILILQVLVLFMVLSYNKHIFPS